jgi:hypothetical protein
MKVYRFENAHHMGVYGGWPLAAADDYYAASGEKEGTIADKRRRPVPAIDFNVAQLAGHVPEEFKFGFASTAQALEWFPSKLGRRAMAREGIKFDAYEVPEQYVIKGGHQVMFFKGHEKLTETLDAVTLDSKGE